MTGAPKLNSKKLCLTTPEAADFLRLAPKTLERMRVDGSGPISSKRGQVFVLVSFCRRSDLVEWLEGFAYGSTSEIDILGP